MRRALVAILVLGAACARQTDPVTIPSERIPFPLSRTAAADELVPQRLRFRVTLVTKSRLREVTRELTTPVPPEESAVRTLLVGPTSTERASGLRTAIPRAARLLGITVVDGIATVDFTQEFQGPASSRDVLLRVAQVVETLVGLRAPDIVAVRFSIEGRLVGVPTTREAAVERPVDGADYAGLRARS